MGWLSLASLWLNCQTSARVGLHIVWFSRVKIVPKVSNKCQIWASLLLLMFIRGVFSSSLTRRQFWGEPKKTNETPTKVTLTLIYGLEQSKALHLSYNPIGLPSLCQGRQFSGVLYLERHIHCLVICCRVRLNFFRLVQPSYKACNAIAFRRTLSAANHGLYTQPPFFFLLSFSKAKTQ